MQKISIFLVFIFQAVFVFAQNTEISGNAKSYAGDTLIFYSYRDYITFKKSDEIKAIVDSAGNFSVSITADKTKCYYVDLIVFRGQLFAEPGKKYIVVLPQKTQKNISDLYNPYFSMQDFFIRMPNADQTDLNTQISKFDGQYNAVFEKLFENFANKPNPSLAKKLIEELNAGFPSGTNYYLDDYIRYESAILKFQSYQHNPRKLIREHFNGAPQFDNPAYNDAFNQIIGNWFDTAENPLKLYQAIDTKSWSLLNDILSEDSLFQNTDFREFLLINSLKKLFFKEPNMKKNITQILIQASEKAKNTISKNIATDFVTNSTKLINGNAAPDFQLVSQAGKKMSLPDFSGKFVYLSFFSPDSYTSIKEIALLKNLYEQKIDLLEIVTVWYGGKISDMKKFTENNNCTWTFLYCNDKKLLKQYNIRVYPSYFLLNPDAILIAAPAGSPENNFEGRYYKEYQNWKRELLRKKDNKLNNK